MKNKDYSVIFGKTNAAKKMAEHLGQCDTKEQEKVSRTWNSFNKGINEINRMRFYRKGFKQLWFNSFKTRISENKISLLSQTLLLNLISAKFRQSLKED